MLGRPAKRSYFFQLRCWAGGGKQYDLVEAAFWEPACIQGTQGCNISKGPAPIFPTDKVARIFWGSKARLPKPTKANSRRSRRRGRSPRRTQGQPQRRITCTHNPNSETGVDYHSPADLYHETWVSSMEPYMLTQLRRAPNNVGTTSKSTSELPSLRKPRSRPARPGCSTWTHCLLGCLRWATQT